MSWHFLAKPVPSRPFPVGTTGRQGRDDYPISRPVSRRDRDSRRGGPGPWGSLAPKPAKNLPNQPNDPTLLGQVEDPRWAAQPDRTGTLEGREGTATYIPSLGFCQEI